MNHKHDHDTMSGISLDQLATITGGARVYAKSGNDPALTTALTTMQSSLDSLKTQNNTSSTSTMLPMMMMMMMRR